MNNELVIDSIVSLKIAPDDSIGKDYSAWIYRNNYKSSAMYLFKENNKDYYIFEEVMQIPNFPFVKANRFILQAIYQYA